MAVFRVERNKGYTGLRLKISPKQTTRTTQTERCRSLPRDRAFLIPQQR